MGFIDHRILGTFLFCYFFFLLLLLGALEVENRKINIYNSYKSMEVENRKINTYNSYKTPIKKPNLAEICFVKTISKSFEIVWNNLTWLRVTGVIIIF